MYISLHFTILLIMSKRFAVVEKITELDPERRERHYFVKNNESNQEFELYDDHGDWVFELEPRVLKSLSELKGQVQDDTSHKRFKDFE
ncbi:hypothetical protein P9112_013737 [Eukaryota sp. TZLM1-RC]